MVLRVGATAADWMWNMFMEAWRSGRVAGGRTGIQYLFHLTHINEVRVTERITEK